MVVKYGLITYNVIITKPTPLGTNGGEIRHHYKPNPIGDEWWSYNVIITNPILLGTDGGEIRTHYLQQRHHYKHNPIGDEWW